MFFCESKGSIDNTTLEIIQKTPENMVLFLFQKNCFFLQMFQQAIFQMMLQPTYWWSCALESRCLRDPESWFAEDAKNHPPNG